MATKTVSCKNLCCRYHNSDDTCSKKGKITIDYNGCQSSKINLFYYIKAVFEKMNNSNFIVNYCLRDDLCFGIYAICQIYGLKFFSTRGMLGFLKKDEDKVLNIQEIVNEPFDNDEFVRLNGIVLEGKAEEFINSQRKSNKEDNEEDEIENEVENSYGWLSPTGKFFAYDWGEHEQGAIDIIEKKYKDEDWWEEERAGDFLVSKNWILIDNPTGYNICVTKNESKRITKAQKEFLFNYFTTLKMHDKAKEYLEE